MVKKRKLRSSAPESSNPNTEPEQSQSQSQPQPQHPQVEQEQEQIEQQEQQQTIEEEDEEKTEKQEQAQGQHMEEEDNNKEKDREEEKEDEGGDDDQTVNPSSTKSTEPAEEELEMEMEEEAVEKILEPFSKEQLALLLKEAVSKHPEFVESVEKLADADPARRKIFVHGLGWDSNTDTLNGVFGKYGEIEDCKAVCDKVSGKSKGYGFILFKQRSGARKALKQPQKKIGNRITSCQLASDGPPTSVPTAPPPPPPTTTVSEYTQRKIFVSNVSAELDPQKLLDFFSKFGEIEDGPLGLDRQTGKPKGFALFVYKTADGAKKALDDPHKNYEGHILHCQKAIDGPKHSKSSFYQQQQQQQHPSFHHHSSARKDKAKYSSAAPGGGGMGTGHLMAPSVGYNPPVALAAPSLTPALGQALTALLATQGSGFGITNLLGRGLGAPVNQGVPPMMNNAGYGNPVGGAGGYGNQPVNMQGGGGYQNTQMGQGGPGRSQPGGAPYSGHGH